MSRSLIAEMQTGCKSCWPDSADVAFAARRSFATVAELIDESHYRVVLLKCPKCGQQYVSVFTETIDWADGEDPQYWSVMPLSSAEAESLRVRQGGLAEELLVTLGAGRRCLQRDYPKGAEPRCYWTEGLQIGPHD